MASPALGQSVRPQAEDDLRMRTDNTDIVSKRSVERLYYPDEPHYFRYFVTKVQKRSSLINRSYWLRLRAVHTIVANFLLEPTDVRKVVVNLGCGSDTLPWHCHVRHPTACQNTLFVDVDFPGLMRKKRDKVLEIPQLRELLGKHFVVSEHDNDPVLLRSDKYCQLGCDLRENQLLCSSLESLLNLSTCEVLFVSAASMVYMETSSIDSLLQWASSIGHAQFCLLEPMLPQGADHPFAQSIVRHFGKLGTPLRSIDQYPTLDSQKSRFVNRGWHQVETWDLWEVWSSDCFLAPFERARLDDVEPFDEWEDFILFARHHFILHARTSPSHSLMMENSLQRYAQPKSRLGAVMTYQSDTKAPRRRLGNAMILSNTMGQKFAVNMMGMSSSGLADTYSVYCLGSSGVAPRLPLTGPLPRMAYSLTDLGEFGVLLVGGRGPSGSAMSDCWVLRKGVDSCWHATWRLPSPLFRHSAIRLKDSSVALVVGGKMDPSRISHDIYVFHPEHGWMRCEVKGTRPEPAFGAILCNTSEPSTRVGVFGGLLAGGVDRFGQISTRTYSWHLNLTQAQPTIKFKENSRNTEENAQLCVLGAQVVDLGSCTVVCGGVGTDPSMQGRTITVVTVLDDGYSTASVFPSEDGIQTMPFMIGSSIVETHGGLAVLGGGATCFSMGTFWETGTYSIELPSGIHGLQQGKWLGDRGPVEFVESVKMVSNRHDAKKSQTSAMKGSRTSIPRIRVNSEKHFQQLLQDRKPVIIEGLALGECMQKWQPEYMVERVGQQTEVTVHECPEDTEKMDFNSKNFRYVTDSFGAVMSRVEAGGRLYLRSLSRAKPSESPANIEEDYPSLAADFVLPTELDYVRQHLFSSVLRISGRVNMWLHYDVMANVYTQIQGSKRMMLFPPSDVTQLCFAPGASSSSLDVFSALDTPSLAATHAHEALLSPGDMLLLPPMWLHTATPTTDMSVAVNIFFRDLDSGYSTGRDVYGNRDLAAYEKGRQDAARIKKGFEGLPGDIQRFYMARIADELVQGAESG